jgi:V/A-type H+-transporting ATPase subunit D
MGLRLARASLAMATRGARLLRTKRDALAVELMKLTPEVLAGRERLDTSLLQAARALVLARAFDGEQALEALAMGAGRAVSLETRWRSVWGLPIPEVFAPRLARAADARGSSPVGWSLSGCEAARFHEQALEALLGVASKELYLKRLGEEIRDTSRRINGLEQLMIPRLEKEVARIDLALEERAREDAVRLKRFRSRRGGTPGRPPKG